MHDALPNAPPLIKLRGAETAMIGKTECRAGSFMHSLGVDVSPDRYMLASTFAALAVIIPVLALIMIVRSFDEAKRQRR